MLNEFLLATLGASLALGTPAQTKSGPRDGTQPIGTNPISRFDVEYLGFQNSSNSCSKRDLGFTGVLAGKWYAIYGDTLWCAEGVGDPFQDPDGFHGMARDSISRMTDNPLLVDDLHVKITDNGDAPHQQQFVPYNESWVETNSYGFGGTSLVESSDGVGAMFYLVNTDKNVLKGAGIAKVEIQDGEPTATKRSDIDNTGYWWPADSDPHYGDIATFEDPRSNYIYAWGWEPTSVSHGTGLTYVYVTRVKNADAFDLSKYEYWWGADQGWKNTRLDTFTPDTAAFYKPGQGQFVWSDHFKCYIFVHISPWTPDVNVSEADPIDGGFDYAGVAHPYLDEVGKTLTISFTNNNHIQVIKATFLE
ncbi:hypothetical protein F5X99DRAFT_430164 [Biscogniauxia marginata]|nr:hypothetical protein F5X99DRAFT_430164 [Biscogniauxia marginata]